MKEVESTRSIPKWLKNLQENSWELELLISGGAIFTLFQVSDWFIDFYASIRVTNMLPGSNEFLILGMLGIKLLTVGFVLHLILRAVWLGLVCINYVFPEGIQSSKLALKPPYKNYYKPKDNLFYEIELMDQAAGMIMFFSIASAIIIAGAITYIFCFVTIPYIIAEPTQVYFMSVIWLMLVYYIDFFSFGLLRKIRFISYLTYPFFIIIDIVTFRIFYSKAIRLFNTNIKKIIVVSGFIIISIIALFFTYATVYPMMHWPNIIDARHHRSDLTPTEENMSYDFYMDEIEKRNAGRMLTVAAIQSQIIKERYLKVFILYQKRFDHMVSPGTHLSENVDIIVDDSLHISNIIWYDYRAQHNDQMGIMALIDISHLSNDHHIIQVGSRHGGESIKIPFWKDYNLYNK